MKEKGVNYENNWNSANWNFAKMGLFFLVIVLATVRADMKHLLGGKGANLAEMTNLGIPVPPGFTITTEVCDAYYK